MNAKNLRGSGKSADAAYYRKLRSDFREHRTGSDRPDLLAGGDCPDCGAQRRTAETLRVHRWLAHGVKEAA